MLHKALERTSEEAMKHYAEGRRAYKKLIKEKKRLQQGTRITTNRRSGKKHIHRLKIKESEIIEGHTHGNMDRAS
ncbi:hypothetical protein C0J52_27048 [Blattella germanica]|nr:hypothetical protein C0J52_27048 [Blattella germanica]